MFWEIYLVYSILLSWCLLPVSLYLYDAHVSLKTLPKPRRTSPLLKLGELPCLSGHKPAMHTFFYGFYHLK